MEDEKKITDEVEVDYAPDIDNVRVLDEDKIEVVDCNEDKE